MAIRPVTYYQVVCDYPGCEFSTEDAGSDFTAYGDSDQAVEDWGYGEHQAIEYAVPSPVHLPSDPPGVVELDVFPIHLCDEHRVVTE